MKELGIEPSLLVAQIINFSIIMFVLSKLLYKPILAMLEKRRKEIERGLALTEKMKAEEQAWEQQREKSMQLARKDAKALIDEAKKTAAEEAKKIIAQAHEDATGIMEQAKADARESYAVMSRQARKEAVDVAVAMARRLTSDILSESDQHKLITRQLKELKAV